MNHRQFTIWATLFGLLSLLALLLTGCAPSAAPTAAAPPTAAVGASTGLPTLHFFYTDW